MSTTKELVAAFNTKDPAVGIDVRGDQYAWRLDVDGASYWISQKDDAAFNTARKSPVPTDREDTYVEKGEVVGSYSKVSVDGTTLFYGPVQLRANAWSRVQALVTRE